MRMRIEFDMDNAAFDDDGALESARILRSIADRVAADWRDGIAKDINGNTVGKWSISDVVPPRFTEAFDSLITPGETITCVDANGRQYTAEIMFDSDSHIDDSDAYNPDQSVTGCSDEDFAKLLAARKAYFDDEWFYCTVCLYVNVELVGSLGAVECNYPGSDNSYLLEVANELLAEHLASEQSA